MSWWYDRRPVQCYQRGRGVPLVIRGGFPLVNRGGFPLVIRGGFPLVIRGGFPLVIKVGFSLGFSTNQSFRVLNAYMSLWYDRSQVQCYQRGGGGGVGVPLVIRGDFPLVIRGGFPLGYQRGFSLGYQRGFSLGYQSGVFPWFLNQSKL